MSLMTQHTDAEHPPALMQMFINSTDTLRHRQINQKLNKAWNDRPPLFEVSRPTNRFWNRDQQQEQATKHVTEDEDPNLLKGMIRKGIPAPLRCAIWLSNIIQASHPHQPLSYAHEYRTLAKVRVLDHGYDCLWNGTLEKSAVKEFSFGHPTIFQECQEYPGLDSLKNVLFALDYVLGDVDYAPLIPTLAKIILGFMSESYCFCAIREMAHSASWYWASSKAQHVAHGKAFMDILEKLHPSTAHTLQNQKCVEKYTDAIFVQFFQVLLNEPDVIRIMDIYTLEGVKVLFRFGVALAVLYQREWKDNPIKNWWEGLVNFCQNKLNLEILIKKAYGVHGKGIKRRYRFPRRPILARIVQLEEERYWNEHQEGESDDGLTAVQPLGLVEAPPPPQNQERIVAKLATTLVRTQLAEWLPLSLRFTKLELIYSTNHHGRTLENFYRNVSKAKHTILVLEPLDSSQVVVGMYASQTWHASPKIYGDGSCFLFRIQPENSKCWKWHPQEILELDEGRNKTALLEQFQVGTHNYFSMGGNPDGSCGLRLNEDLTRAESSPAAGFDNEPLFTELFEVGLVEVYQMVRQMDGVAVH